MSCRFKVLADCASYESWQKALAYHQEMRRHGKELPASELIEFVEVSGAASGPAFLHIPDLKDHYTWLSLQEYLPGGYALHHFSLTAS